ncbi:PAAR-like protein [Caviibacter abscessus]|uniref:PAAR-like protein n=1 Tax=Caviibacter abscessus TaxID=1766719 RepID=UPI00082D88F5|nr:PAAR-like protein [Caviibacter abscessus]
MLLKKFENENIPNEVKTFYDDLSIKYLKSEGYDYGKEIQGPVIAEKIGRYLLSKENINLIDPSIDLGFLIYTGEGHEKQDELVIYYHKNILLHDLKDIMELHNNSFFDISDIPCTNGKKTITKEEVLKNLEKINYTLNNLIKVTPAGILIASHIFGTRKVKKLFNKESNFCDENNIPISYFIDDKTYDVEFITGQLKENKVIPKVNEKNENEINLGEKFIGQNSTNLFDQLKKFAKDNKILEKILDNLKTKDNKEIIKNVEKIINPKSNSYVAKPSEKLNIILNEKFENEYQGNKFREYFEDTTNKTIDEENKNTFNEVLKAKEKYEPKSIIEQNGFDKYRNFGENKITTFEYIYDECMKSIDPLDKLEKLLSFFTCKYQDESKFSFAKNITVKFFKSKLKNKLIDKVNEVTGAKLPKEEINYISNFGICDVDDIKFNIKRKSMNDYPKIKEYKFLKMFKEQNLVKRSFGTHSNGKRIYKRARRFLDNLQLALILKMTNFNKDNIDGHAKRSTNIVNNYIVFFDEYLSGYSFDDYKWFYDIKKEFNVTNLFIRLLKTHLDYRDIAISKLSDFMYELKYETYTDNKNMANDKSEIKKIFKTKDSLEYNMRLRNSYNIADFYTSFYQNKDEAETEKFVCEGAKISCSFAPDITNLIVTKSEKKINGLYVATINDKKIIPFKSCSVNKVCVAKLNNWKKKNNILIGNNPVLMNTSTCNCSIGGLLTIVDSNQNIESIRKIEKRDTKRKFMITDYKSINLLYDFTKKDYFSSFAFYLYTDKLFINNLDVYYLRKLKRLLKPSFDEKKLQKEDVIPVVDTSINSILNAYPMGKILKGYYYGKIRSLKTGDKYIDIGMSLSKERNFNNFFDKAKRQLDVIFAPYKLQSFKNEKPYWMDKAFGEYNKNYSREGLRKAVIKYHKYGGGINADIRTAWCASFVNYILNTGFQSASSQGFYTQKGKQYFNKINDAKYGAILVLRNKNKISGHCTFILNETDKGYFCLGGNQGGRIKKSFYPKNSKFYGIFWPK